MSSIERCPLFGVSFIRGDMYVHVYAEAHIQADCSRGSNNIGSMSCMCVLITRG